MNIRTDIWPQIIEAHHALGRAMPDEARAEFATFAAKFGVEPRRIFHFVYVVENFDPNALSVAAYQQRDPFDAPQGVQAHFDQWLKLRWIETPALRLRSVQAFPPPSPSQTKAKPFAKKQKPSPIISSTRPGKFRRKKSPFSLHNSPQNRRARRCLTQMQSAWVQFEPDKTAFCPTPILAPSAPQNAPGLPSR